MEEERGRGAKRKREGIKQKGGVGRPSRYLWLTITTRPGTKRERERERERERAGSCFDSEKLKPVTRTFCNAIGRSSLPFRGCLTRCLQNKTVLPATDKRRTRNLHHARRSDLSFSVLPFSILNTSPSQHEKHRDQTSR